MDVSFLHDGNERLIGPLARLQQAREEAANLNARHLQIDRSHRVPCGRWPTAAPDTVALARAVTAPLVPLGPQVLADLQLHPGLTQHPHPSRRKSMSSICPLRNSPSSTILTSSAMVVVFFR